MHVNIQLLKLVNLDTTKNTNMKGYDIPVMSANMPLEEKVSLDFINKASMEENGILEVCASM